METNVPRPGAETAGAVAPGATGGAPHSPADVVALAEACRLRVESGIAQATRTLLGDLRVYVSGEPGVYYARLEGLSPRDLAWARGVVAALEATGIYRAVSPSSADIAAESEPRP